MAFVAGTLIFTNAMGGAFDDIIEGSTADVEVTPKGAGDFDSVQDSRTLPASLVTKLEGLPEVGQAWATDSLQTVFVIGKDGKVVGGNGPPGLAFNYTGLENLNGDKVIDARRRQAAERARPDRARREDRGQGRVRRRRHASSSPRRATRR